MRRSAWRSPRPRSSPAGCPPAAPPSSPRRWRSDTNRTPPPGSRFPRVHSVEGGLPGGPLVARLLPVLAHPAVRKRRPGDPVAQGAAARSLALLPFEDHAAVAQAAGDVEANAAAVHPDLVPRRVGAVVDVERGPLHPFDAAPFLPKDAAAE